MSTQHATNGSARFDTRSWITLRWVRGSRYYRVHLEQDLWSAWLLTRVNGRTGTPLGRARAKPAPTIDYALLELAVIARRRRQRGYELTS
jgi:hypothetical protein